MSIGAAGDDAVAVFRQARSERLRVEHDLPLIVAELRLERFVKAYRLRRYDMHERSALHTWENRRVDLLGESLFTHDNAAAWAAQTFVRCGGDKLCVGNR